MDLVKEKSLAKCCPELALEWHPTKNGDLLPRMFTHGTKKNVWWKCGKCGHEWQAIVKNRVGGAGCPYCSSNRILFFNIIYRYITLNKYNKYNYQYINNCKRNTSRICKYLTNQKLYSIINLQSYFFTITYYFKYAGVAELADAPDLGSGIFRCAGSTPVARTNTKSAPSGALFVLVPRVQGLKDCRLLQGKTAVFSRRGRVDICRRQIHHHSREARPY